MKTLTELQKQLDEVNVNVDRRVYGADIRLGNDGNIVRARRIKVGDQAPSTVGLRAPGVGEQDEIDPSTTKDFKTRLKQIYSKYKKTVNDTFKEDISENTINEDPPYILVLKRQNVRTYPNNVKIALYYNEKLQKHFSVPYGSGISTAIQSESIESDNTEKVLVSSILNVFCNLTEENKIKMLDMINGDNESFEKVKGFCESK
jgi:hypothetical protein